MKRLLLCTALLLSFVRFLPAQIVNIEDKRGTLKDTTAWYERGDLGFNWVKNTQTVLSINAGFQLEYQHHNRRILSISSVQFVKAGSTNFVNQGFQHLRYNISFSPWFTHEFFGQLQYNENLRIGLRGLLGSGGRFRLTGKSKQSAWLGIAYMFEYDEETNGPIHHDHRMSSYLSLHLNPAKNVTLASTSYYQPLLANFSDFRLSSNTTLVFKFSKQVSFTNTLSLLYDSRAPEGVPTLSHSYRSGIRYEFK